MFKRFKQWFVPCQGNDYEPHLLRAWPVAVLLVVIVAFFGITHIVERSLISTGSSLAAVVSSVLVDLTNFDRANQGLHGLATNQTLQQAAQLKANDMASAGYFAHNSPDGKTPWYWLGEAGYTFSYAGENLAVFFGDSADVERAWMNSPGHRANILSSNFTEVGIATAEGYYQGQKTVFVVQMFGTPSMKAPIATLESAPAEVASANVPEGEVSGQSITVIGEEDVVLAPEPDIKIIQQDDAFIAVKDSSAVPVPSAGSPEMQSSLWERMIASPQTALSYAYAVIAGVVGVTLILLVFLEMRVQRPKSIIYGIIILLVLGILFYLSYTGAVVASSAGLSGIADFFS